MSNQILFDELKPCLKYFPIKIGKAEMVYRESNNNNFHQYGLFCDGIQRMTLHHDKRGVDPLHNCELKDQFFEINLAEKRVVTTGLGFGLLQTSLALKENVSEVIVYEKYEDVIRMFELFVKESDFDDSKIKIINKEAIESINEECDWLILDHFEDKILSEWEIIDISRSINNDCKAINFLFWPMPVIYDRFCRRKNLNFNNDSFSLFKQKTKLAKLPENLPNGIFDKMPYFNKPIFNF